MPICLRVLTVLADIWDAGMVTLAIFTMNIAHPGLLLGSKRDDIVGRENMLMKQISNDSQSSLV
jgi:hypothetical protein